MVVAFAKELIDLPTRLPHIRVIFSSSAGVAEKPCQRAAFKAAGELRTLHDCTGSIQPAASIRRALIGLVARERN
jgi:hypothetical protein